MPVLKKSDSTHRAKSPGLKPHANPKDDGEAFFSGRLELAALKDLNPTKRGYAAGGRQAFALGMRRAEA